MCTLRQRFSVAPTEMSDENVNQTQQLAQK